MYPLLRAPDLILKKQQQQITHFRLGHFLMEKASGGIYVQTGAEGLVDAPPHLPLVCSFVLPLF